MIDLPQDKPKFDPNKPSEPVKEPEAKVVPMQEDKPKPKFNPDKPFEEAEPPKKKEDTESTVPSGDDFGQHAWPPKQLSVESSEKKPPYQYQEKDGFFEGAYKGAAGLVKDVLPQSFMTARAAGTRTTPYTEKDVNDLKAISDAANYLFRKNISDGNIMKALSIGDKEAREYIQEQIKQPEEYQKKQMQTKLDLLKAADKEREEFNKFTKNTVKTLGDIESPKDVASYISYTIGQAVPQIGISLMTGGMGSYIQEYSEVYDRQVNKIAEDNSITPEQVIKEGKDNPAGAEAAGLLAAALDRIGVEAIFKNFGKEAFKSILKMASKYEAAKQVGKAALKTAATEGVTEGAQYIVEETGSSTSAGRDVETALGDISGRELLESMAAGATSGLFLGGAGEVQSTLMGKKTTNEVIKEETENVDKTSPASIDAAAETIQAKIGGELDQGDQNPQEYLKTIREYLKTAQEYVSTAKEYIDKQEDAKTVQQDQGAVPEQRQGLQGSQENISGDIQQSTPEGQVAPETQQQTQGEPVAQAATTETQTTAATQETPTPTTETTTEQPTAQEPKVTPAAADVETKQAALGARMEGSNEPEGIKSRVAGRDRYIPRKIIQTDEEAKKILDEWSDPDFAEWAIRDVSNEIPAGTRGTLAANLYQQYKKEAEAATEDNAKQSLYEKAADLAVWAQNNLTRAGQEAAIAGKIWKSVLSDEDILVTAMEKQNQQQARKLLAPIQEEVAQTREQFDEQIRKIVAQKVTEGVEERLKRAKLITADKKKEITNFFDNLKVKDPKGTINDITQVVGATVWNGSVEAVKRAVLAGADVANAVQAGIDYIRDNYKGSDFDEAEYKAMVVPAATRMIVPVPIDPAQVDPDAIKTKKLKGKKKKDFINQLVEAHNSGKLTDAKFESIYAEKLGHKPFSSEERGKIRELAKVISEVEKFKEAVQKDFTAENIKKYQGLLKNAQQANKDLQQYNNRNPSSIWDTLATMMQGNLLSPISLLTNIYANVAYQPLRFATSLTGGIIDKGLTELAKTNVLGENVSNIIGKKPTIDLVALQKGYFQGGWNGLMEGLYQLGTGSLVEDKNLREIQSSFSPVNAIRRWADKDRALPQKINDAIEGTLGWPPEVVFRLLNLGDKPFKRSAELARAYELAATKDLKGQDLLKFIMFPDAESQQQIEEAGKEATFQNESTLAKVAEAIVGTILNGGRIRGHEIPGIASIPVIGGPLKVVAKTQIPFVRTPANILAKTFDYAIPPLTFIRGVYNISKGNKRTGSRLIGDAMVGMMMYAVGKMLVEAGLMTWNPDQRDDKAKQAMYTNEPPNSINITAVNRGLLGDGWATQDDDVWVSYQKLGLTGIVLQNYANQYYHAVKEGKEPFSDIIGDIGLSGVKTTASALDQSFLTGTNTFLEALKDPEGYAGDRWILGTTEALTATVLPRSLTSIGTASDEYIRDTRDPKIMNALANTFKAKLFMGDQLPSRVNVWGEKVTGNPEGRNRMIYYLFDPTKFKSVDQEAFRYKIYKAWKENGFDNDYLPGSPKREVTVKEVKLKLTAQEYEKLATYVGEQRAYLAGMYAGSREKLDPEKLKDIYDKGAKKGKKKFLMEMGWNILSKKKLEEMSENR